MQQFVHKCRNIENGKKLRIFPSIFQLPVLILLLYTVIGAIIFWLIEGPNEKYELEQLRREREKLLEDTAFRLNTIKSMTPLQVKIKILWVYL